MFGTFMADAWVVVTLAAVVGGAIGFFVAVRGAAFAAHAIPNVSFAGAAAAAWLGFPTLLGLGIFSTGGAAMIHCLSRGKRHAVPTGLTLVFALGLGLLLLSFSDGYAGLVYATLFGDALGVSRATLLPVAALSVFCLITLAVLGRALLLESVLPQTRSGQRLLNVDLAFLLVLALAGTLAVPVIGTTMIFSLMVAPAATARLLSSRPGHALALSILIALAVSWAGLTLTYVTDWPLGFFVGVLGLLTYLGARVSHDALGRRALLP